MTGTAIQPCALTPADYLDSSVLAVEKERIFDRQWHIVGLTRDLPEKDDWRLYTIAGTEIIIQNIGNGEIRAYSNVCPHRFNALKDKAKGNGALRCSYHYWSFDYDGIPKNVPLRGDVSLEECQSQARLERWSVELCGEWIFVARKPRSSLEEFLGPFVDPLVKLSQGLGEEIGVFEEKIPANWKLLLENTMEGDHSCFVHPKTFAKISTRPVTHTEQEAKPPHISYVLGLIPPDLTESTIRKVEKIFDRAVLPRMQGHLYRLLSPSATIGWSFNRQISLMTYQPITPSLTLGRARLFIPKIENLSITDRAILDRILPLDTDFTHQLFDEDNRICTSVQRGLASAPLDMKGCMMPGEWLVHKWQRYWLEDMGRIECGIGGIAAVAE
jgi:phenylpropionate dioxygenase-like ring-hydroxylating dioxygenase large terminal subunit